MGTIKSQYKLTIIVFMLEIKRFGAGRELGFWISLGRRSSAHERLTDFKMNLYQFLKGIRWCGTYGYQGTRPRDLGDLFELCAE